MGKEGRGRETQRKSEGKKKATGGDGQIRANDGVPSVGGGSGGSGRREEGRRGGEFNNFIVRAFLLHWRNFFFESRLLFVMTHARW